MGGWAAVKCVSVRNGTVPHSAATSFATMPGKQTMALRKCGTLRMFNKQTNSLTNVRNCSGKGSNKAGNNV